MKLSTLKAFRKIYHHQVNKRSVNTEPNLFFGFFVEHWNISIQIALSTDTTWNAISEKSYKCSVNKISVKISHHLSWPNAKITFIKQNWLNKPSVTMVSNYFHSNSYSFCVNRCDLGRDEKIFFLLVPDACKWRRLFFNSG